MGHSYCADESDLAAGICQPAFCEEPADTDSKSSDRYKLLTRQCVLRGNECDATKSTILGFSACGAVPALETKMAPKEKTDAPAEETTETPETTETTEPAEGDGAEGDGAEEDGAEEQDPPQEGEQGGEEETGEQQQEPAPQEPEQQEEEEVVKPHFKDYDQICEMTAITIDADMVDFQ